MTAVCSGRIDDVKKCNTKTITDLIGKADLMRRIYYGISEIKAVPIRTTGPSMTTLIGAPVVQRGSRHIHAARRIPWRLPGV